MKILVIGARGFIGAALVRSLVSRGDVVTCVSRGSTPEAGNDLVKWVRVDHLSQKSWDEIFDDRFDVVYHLGWSTIPRTAEADPVSDLIDNVGGGLRILSSIRKISPKTRIVFSSSGGTVYGRSQENLLNETHPLNPISIYGVSKITFENYLRLFRDEYNIECISTRISNPYGPNQNTHREFGAISTFVSAALSDKPISIFGSWEITRDYIYISDVTSALMKIGSIDDPPAVINIGSGVGSSLRDILKAIESILGRPAKAELIERRRFDIERVVLDISLVCALCDWRPRIGLREGIALMLHHHRE